MNDSLKFSEFDLAVIGAGSGGFAAARTASASGLKVAVIDGGAEIGGLCILRGCMPSKALLYAAEVRHLSRKGGVWGLEPGDLGFDFKKVQARKDAMVENFASFRREQLAKGPFTFIRSKARFKDPHTLALEDGATLTSGHIVISTGSKIGLPLVPGLCDIGYLTSDTALGLRNLPKSMIVLGGGPVAVELAQFFQRFDVQVTLIQRSAHILKGFDTDAAEAVETALTKEGMVLYTGTKVLEAQLKNGCKSVIFERAGERIEVNAEEILYAMGRIPNTRDLALDRAGVATENGRIATNSSMQTSVPHIYAAGDCTGPHEIVHIAIQQGETAARNIVDRSSAQSIDYRLLCEVVFSDPQAAQVGLTEKEARLRQIPYLAASYPFNDHGKSLIMEALEGFVKLLANPETGEIIGGSVVGPSGGELIHEIVAAMHKRMTVRELAVMPHYHPTLAEIWTYPAEELTDKIPIKHSV
jgi:pyruvate/2-oxoglutarate dehydrogenase complex dihydrolipoamide dehydrogenase (E3) component